MILRVSPWWSHSVSEMGSSTKESLGDAPQRMLQSTVPTESTACIPFASVRNSTINNPNTDAVCRAGGEKCSVCCRVFEWLVCDSTNVLTQLPCVCNRLTRTSAPTTEPSSSVPPSFSPTKSPGPSETPSESPSNAPSTSEPSGLPSLAPTDRATQRPSYKPSPHPSFVPTSTQSGAPSFLPSSIPTLGPVTTSHPASPSMLPSQQLPTGSTGGLYVTKYIEDSSGSRVEFTSCTAPLDSTNFLIRSNYTFEYQLYTNAPNASTFSDGVLFQQIHDAVARHFFDCSLQKDSLWWYESLPNSIETAVACTGGSQSFEDCFVVAASESIWIRHVPVRRNRRLGDFTARFIRQINLFIDNLMAAGTFDGVDGIAKVGYIQGPDKITTTAPTFKPTSSFHDTPSDLPTVGNGFEAHNATKTRNEGARLSNAAIGGLCALGVLFFLVISIALFRRTRSSSQDGNTNEKTGLSADALAIKLPDSDEDSVSIPDARTRTDSMLDEEDDPYTSLSPIRRSKRPPLHSQDELDRAVDERLAHLQEIDETPPAGRRKGLSRDTIDL